MADSLNIKNPSIRQGDLDLRTDEQGYITSISGHPIAGGGGGGGTNYYGDNEYIQFKNGTVNTFTVTDKVKDVVDNLTEKIALQIDAQTYNKNDIDTKLSAKQDELVFAGYEDKIETINGSGFIVNGYVSDFAYNIDKNNFNKKIDYLSASVSGKEDKLTFEYDEDNKVSAINGSALAGQGGTTYTPGQYINIDSNNEISVTGVVAADEYATYSGDWNNVSNSYKTNSGSFLTNEDLTNYATKTYVDGKDPVLIGDSNITAASSTVDGHTQWNLAVNVTPVVTDTKLVGDNCVTAHTTQTSGEWIVGLEQTAYEAIGSVGGIATDVTTLKNASANWNEVSDKLDTTAAAQTYLEKATYASDSATFLTKTSADNDYAPKSITATVNTLTGASAGWNEVTAKLDASVASTTYQTKEDMVDYLTKSEASTTYLVADDITGKLDKSIYSNASGNWEASYNVLTAYSAAGTWLTAHQSLTNYYTKSETSGANELSTEFAKYVTSSNSTITGTKQYALTTAGWAEVQAGASLTASSGINIDNNLINVELGDNLKFDTYSSVTTEDNIRVSSVRAGYYDNQYTIVNKDGIETHFTSSPNTQILTLTTHGLNNSLVGGNRSITANYDLNHLFFKSYNNNGTYSGDYSQVEIKVLQETAPEATQHRSSITLTDYYEGVEHTGLITVEKIAQWDQGGSFTGVTTAGSISGDGLTNPLGLVTSAEQALTSVSNKVDKPTSLVNQYLVLRTDGEGNVSGWCDFQDQSYSKSEADRTFVATANIDTTTLSGDGKSSSTKLGVKTDVIATKDYVNSSFLPLSGGTISGQLVVSGGSSFDNDNLKIIRYNQNGYGRIGLASNGALAVKVDDSNSNTTQINVAANASYNELIQVQHGGTTAYLIPAVTSTTTAGLTNDGILHIILES